MNIYATPCDKNEECFGGSDEKHCDYDYEQNLTFVITSEIFLTLYLGLKFFRKISSSSCIKEEHSSTISLSFPIILTEETFENDFFIHYENEAFIDKLNAFLFNIVEFRQRKDKKRILCQFYDAVAKVTKYNERMISAYLNNNLGVPTKEKFIFRDIVHSYIFDPLPLT